VSRQSQHPQANANRLRLDRGGDRQLNRALHTIAITRASHDPTTKTYLARKQAEGKTKKDALRCLKRHLARRFHHLLSQPAQPADQSPRIIHDHPNTPQNTDHTITSAAPTPMICTT
jgi:hypothetical protein